MHMYQGLEGAICTLHSADFTRDIHPTTWVSYRRVVQASFLPEQSYGEDRPSEEGDFGDFRQEVVLGLNALANFMNKLVSTVPIRTYFDRETLVSTLILCGEHSSAELWTTEESCNLATSCVKSLCIFYNCQSLRHLVLGLSERATSPCFKQALLMLRPKLLQHSWRKHPAAVLTYRWLLMEVNAPHFSEYLDDVSPTTLLLLDDHDDVRRLNGLQCLSHIIANVARTVMCQRGFDKVFYKALEPILWLRKANLIEPAILCLTKLLSLVERGYTRRVPPGTWDLFDDTLNNLLDKMVFEDQIPLRIAYIKSLGPLLSEVGPSVIRWTKPLLSVFDSYMSKESFDTRQYALEAMTVHIHQSHTRLQLNVDFVLFLLLRSLIDLSIEVESQKQNLDVAFLDSLKSTIVFVGKECPEHFHFVASELEYTCQRQHLGIFVTVLKNCVSEISTHDQ